MVDCVCRSFEIEQLQTLDCTKPRTLQVGDNVLDYNPQFMFYITTKLSNPHYTPEVSTKTTIASLLKTGEVSKRVKNRVAKGLQNLSKICQW